MRETCASTSGRSSAQNSTNSKRCLPLKSLNHVSIHCSSVEESLCFYRDLMGFIPVQRPSSLKLDGAWLFNYGIGIHLLKNPKLDLSTTQKRDINPRSDHVSFQCEDIGVVERMLKDKGIVYMRERVEEGGIVVEQLFFHDPDGHMIEICNCDVLPLIPIVAPESPNMPACAHAAVLPVCFRSGCFAAPPAAPAADFADPHSMAAVGQHSAAAAIVARQAGAVLHALRATGEGVQHVQQVLEVAGFQRIKQQEHAVQ